MSDRVHSSGVRGFNSSPISQLQAPLDSERGRVFWVDGHPYKNMAKFAREHGWSPVAFRAAVNANATYFGHEVSNIPPRVPAAIEPTQPPAIIHTGGPLLRRLVKHRLGRSFT